MLYPAQLYREELKHKLISCWYKPEYDYYFCGEYSEFSVPDTTMWRRDFVHLDKDGEVDGYFSYHYNEVAKSLSLDSYHLLAKAGHSWWTAYVI